MSARILIASDDQAHAAGLTRTLQQAGYDVQRVASSSDAVTSVQTWGPGLVLVDLDAVPGLNAQVCRQLRALSSTPLLAFGHDRGARAEEEVFDAGADDCVAKPCDTSRLPARVRALMRRSATGREAAAIRVGDFHVDLHARRVRVHGQAVRLTPKEYDLFVYMAERPNRVLPHRVLLNAVWGEGAESQSEYLRVFMGQLRKKLELDPPNPRYLVTEPWVGYRLNPTGTLQ